MFQLRAGVARWQNFVRPRAIITRAVNGRASRDCAFSVVCLFCRLMCLNRSICIFHPVCCWKQCLHFVKKSHTAAMIRPHGDDLSKLAKICPPILFFHRLGEKNEQKIAKFVSDWSDRAQSSRTLSMGALRTIARSLLCIYFIL